MAMNADSLMDDEADDAVEEEDPRVAARRRAREILQATAMSDGEREAHELRHMRSRDIEIAAMLERRQAPDYQQRRAPSADAEARWEADRLCRTIAPPSSRPPPLQRKEFKRYTDNLEKAIGDLLGERDKRAAVSEQRTTGIEARLATIEQRIAALEAKPVIEHEKQPGQ